MRRFFYATNTDLSAIHNTDTVSSLSPLAVGTTVYLTDSITHHWCRVLRASVGDMGILFDGFGGEYQVQLQSISKKQASVSVISYRDDDRQAPILSKIGLVMSRGDRMDYAIQKSTELGVTAIQLLSSQHGEVNLKSGQVEKKLLHWQQIAIAACEQCGLNRPPLIFAPIPINEWMAHLEEDAITINKTLNPIVNSLGEDAYYQAINVRTDFRLLLSVPAKDQPLMPSNLLSTLTADTSKRPYIELLIGPEGGLSVEESTMAATAGFESWQIGHRILRTETAPVVALATLHALTLASAH